MSAPTPPPPPPTGYTASPPPGSAPGTPPNLPPANAVAKRPGEIKLISRSMLFYWWPVWLMAFVCAIWTWMEDNRLAVVPGHGQVEAAVADGDKLRVVDPEKEAPTAFVFTPSDKEKNWKWAEQPLGRAVGLSKKDEGGRPGGEPFTTRVSRHPALGMAFIVTLLLIVFTTNVPLRGLWSFVALLFIALLVVIISLIPGAWDKIATTLTSWLVFINLATYLIIGGVVFVLWALAYFIFDPRQFVIFAPGQIRVCEHIGDAVEAYPSIGATLSKQRDDPFRHFLLGFGSSDITLKLNTGREIRIPNVLGLSFDLQEVEQMIRTVPSA